MKRLWNAAGCVLVLLAFCAVWYFGRTLGETGLRRLTLEGGSAGEVVLIDPATEFDRLAFTALFALAFALAAGASRSHLRAIVGVSIVALLTAVSLVFPFDRFLAVRPEPGAVRLVYLWPRPSVVIPGDSIRAVRTEWASPEGPMGQPSVWRLFVDTPGRTYRSAATGNVVAVKETLEAARSGAGRTPSAEPLRPTASRPATVP